MFSSLIIIFSSSKKAFYFVIVPITVIYALYTPVGLVFGRPSYHYITAVIATDFLEGKEFFDQIPIISYLKSLLIIVGIFLYRYITTKADIQLYKNKTVICFLIFFALLNQSPFDFFRNAADSIGKAQSELEKLKKLTIDGNWGESTLDDNSKYENYILIIGESARRDYHNAYGYPVENTPFMSKSNGVLVNGLTSGGPNTISSLRLMLTKPSYKTWEPNYDLSIVDLAKSAGLKTYWISNQGYLGEYDTPISAIARRSDKRIFLKYGDYSFKNTSDFLLLDEFKRVMKNSPKEKKLIIMHLYGSHPHACARVSDFKRTIETKDDKYSYLNCYVSSIEKTDSIIKQIYDFMSENKERDSFSILYFSDHGLVHQESEGVIKLNLSKLSKYHYDIPLFEINSDSSDRTECVSFKSGLNFTNGLASWMGIENKLLDKNYNLFDCKNDPDDYGQKDKVKSYVDDPAIDIRGK